MREECFNVVSKAVEECMNSRNLKIDNDRYEILKDYCESIDKIFEESITLEYDCKIDENNKVHLSAIIDDLIIRNPNKRYWDIVFRSSRVTFSYVDDESIQTEFVFPSVFYTEVVG